MHQAMGNMSGKAAELKAELEKKLQAKKEFDEKVRKEIDELDAQNNTETSKLLAKSEEALRLKETIDNLVKAHKRTEHKRQT